MNAITPFKGLPVLSAVMAVMFLCLGVAEAAQIDGSRALEIALADAGVARADALHIEVELEHEHGRDVYEVEFHNRNGGEYEYKIDATTGKIVKRKTKATAQASAGDSKYIGAERALGIALSHAGVAKADAQRTKVRMESRKNLAKYEVEFRTATSKYEYELDAVTGAIIEYEVSRY